MEQFLQASPDPNYLLRHNKQHHSCLSVSADHKPGELNETGADDRFVPSDSAMQGCF